MNLRKRYVCGIFGFPVSHTASPLMQNAALRALDLDGVYLPFEVRPGTLSRALSAVRTLGFTGINVTIPHKEKIMPHLDVLTPEARMIGAVNTVSNDDGTLTGYNTDAQGFDSAVRDSWGRTLSGARITLIGAGGAGRAVAVQAALSGAAHLTIINRGKNRLTALMRHLCKNFPGLDFSGFTRQDDHARAQTEASDLIVNATSLGMERGDPFPLDPDWIRRDAYVYDLVYRPFETAWVKAARRRGVRGSGGYAMLLYQGALAFEIWTGRKAPLEVMKRVLLKYLKDQRKQWRVPR